MTKWSRLFLGTLVFAVVLQLFPPGIALAGKYDATLQESPNVRHVTGYYPSIVIDDFNTTDSVDAQGKWSKGDGVAEVRYSAKTANGPGSPYEGTHVLEAVSGQVKAYEWRTMYKEFSVPLDLSSVKYLTFAANAYGWKTEDYLIRVNLYSGEDKFQSIVKINPNGWNEVAVSIRDWANRSRITQIEFSFMLNYDLAGMRDGDPGYAWWGGNYQIDLLSGSNTLDMDFNIEGETEGFTAQGASAVAAGGELRLAVTDSAPVLVSPPLLHHIGSLNTLEVSMSNASAFDRVRVDWITEESPEWNAAKSAVFDIQSNGSGYEDYDFNLSGYSHWTGLLKQFKLTFLSGNEASSGQIGIDKIGFKNLAPIVVYPGEISRHELTGSLDKIVIAGSIKPEALSKYGSGNIAFFELQPYENERVLIGKTPLSEANASSSFSFETDLKDTNGRSRLFSKFAVAARLADGTYELIDRAHYVTNPEALAPNRYPFPAAASKKGLQVQMVGDAEDLGISHAALNVTYTGALYLDGNVNPANTVVYEYEGQKYYFKKNWIEANDNSIKSLSDNGVTVSLILLAYKENMDGSTPNRYLIHPDAGDNGIVYAFNTTDETGTNYYKAITAFLADRYSREDQKYGRAVNYIVGNEVDAAETWYNMGAGKSIGEFIEDYGRTVRLTNAVLKSRYSNARVYISLTHNWDEELPPNGTNYDGRMIVDTLQKEIISQGDIPWNIAYHPYPENLFDPKAWNAPTSTDRFDTKKITFKNLHVLVEYMKQSRMLYNGEPRRIILSEQGFHSLDNTLEGQKIQAAAYAYAYYITNFLDGIDSFILHRHVDHAGEYGLNLGLWTHDPDISGAKNIPYETKYIYDVFKYIDTSRSLEVTEFAKPIIGISDWREIAPAFDPAKLALREIPQENPAALIEPKQLKDAKMISDFESTDDGWAKAEYVSRVESDSSLRQTGGSSLKAVIMENNVQLGESAGVFKPFDTPLSFKRKPYLFFGIHPTDGPASGTYTARIKVYSGSHVLEAAAGVKPGEWNTIAVNLSEWAYKDQVTKIKIWLEPTERVRWAAGNFHVDAVGMAEGVTGNEQMILK